MSDPTPNRHRSPLEHERDMGDTFDPAAIRRFYDCVECALDPHGAASAIRALAAELATARELIGLLEGEQARAAAAEAKVARLRDAIVYATTELAQSAQDMPAMRAERRLHAAIRALRSGEGE
jgi:hypothetical protein